MNNVHDADRLPNGNTLITLRSKGAVLEVDPAGLGEPSEGLPGAGEVEPRSQEALSLRPLSGAHDGEHPSSVAACTGIPPRGSTPRTLADFGWFLQCRGGLS